MSKNGKKHAYGDANPLEIVLGTATNRWVEDPREALRVDEHFHLASMDRAATPGWAGSESDAVAYTAAVTPLLGALQEKLFAAAKEGSDRRVLVVAQGLDTAGKGGIARHVMGLVDPQGVRMTAFKAPTPEEKEHDFLWRIWKAVPGPGTIGLFDRSHYEDMLVPGAAGTLDDEGFDRYVGQIHDFERQLIDQGTTVVKIALMVSYEEQGLRLLERVDRPDKRWKYSGNDMNVRGQWFNYQSIYERVLRATSFEEAPWYVIPADNKWYSHLAVTEMLLRSLAETEVHWPPARFDVDTERDRVRATLSPQALARYDARIQAKLAKVDARITVIEDAATILVFSAEPAPTPAPASGAAPGDAPAQSVGAGPDGAGSGGTGSGGAASPAAQQVADDAGKHPGKGGKGPKSVGKPSKGGKAAKPGKTGKGTRKAVKKAAAKAARKAEKARRSHS